MATPTSNSVSVSNVSLSGWYIDALIGGTKWGGGVGTAVSLTYSFPAGGSSWSTDPSAGYGPSNGSGEPWNSFAGLNAVEQSAAVYALSQWANVANMSFTQVADSASIVGEIRFAWTTGGGISGAQAHAYYPANAPVGGDVWLNAAAWWGSGFNPGAYGSFTLLHELGHALGLKHTFSASGTNSSVLPANEDGYSYSIMSYSALEGHTGSYVNFNPTTPMPYDIAAIQYLYGANMAYHAGDDTYTFNQGQNYFQTIWDGGGTDTIVWSATTESAVIDLRGGYWSDLGNSLTFTDQNGASLGNRAANVAIYSTVTIENATGGGASDVIRGNDVGNYLNGGAGNDKLYGYAGNDTFDWDAACRAGNDVCYGGLGNDVYVFDTASDQVVENAGEGSDTIWVSFSYSLGTVANVEKLYAIGSAGVVLTGNSANNAMGGSTGNDTLNGGAGADTLSGGAGNDIYIVDNTSDTTTELVSAGTDTVKSSVARTLGANIEKLVLTGSAAISGTGNTLNNTITGNGATNALNGAAGNDVLNGGAGNDVLIGGAGQDTMTGGVGNDVFRFNSVLNATTKDTIKDFAAVNDTIQLENAVFKSLAATGVLNTGMLCLGTSAADANDYIIYNQTMGTLYYDADANGAGAAVQFATLSAGTAVSNADFVVI